MDRLRILVADDSQFMRTAYERILATQDNFEIVGMAEDGRDALEQALRLVPDVAILDIRMPKIDGIEVARRILEEHPDTGIVVISAFDDLAFVTEIMKDSPEHKAYILKTSLDDIGEFLRVVEAVAEGHTVIDPSIVEKLLSRYNRRSASGNGALTKIELGVLELMVEGYDDPGMAQGLNLSQDCVHALIESICEKLGLENMGERPRGAMAVQALVKSAF